MQHEQDNSQAQIPSILFVDDESRILDALRRMLRSQKNKWDIKFTTSGREALELMARQPFKVVISDMKMPEMDGGELLDRIRQLYPETIRFILSGHADKEMILRTIGPTHRFFTKPCDSGFLIKEISKAIATCNTMNAHKDIQAVVSGTLFLPAMPELYAELKSELEKPDMSIKRIAEIISHDVAMTAEILHLVNSSFFGPYQDENNVFEALKYLGAETVKGIILSTGVLQTLPEATLKQFDLRELQKHSIHTGDLCGMIVKDVMPGNTQMIDRAITAGLLHDIGKLILVTNVSESYTAIYQKYKQGALPLHAVEENTLSTTHAEVGGYLAALWGSPQSISDAISCHHQPSTSLNESFSILTAVHIANILTHECSNRSNEKYPLEFDSQYLKKTKTGNRLEGWREIARNIIT
ncbi:response regulator [Verrucomicrobiota bacterium]